MAVVSSVTMMWRALWACVCSRRRGRLRLLCRAVLVSLAALIIYSWYMWDSTVRCHTKHSLDILRQVCRDFQADKVAGNLCEDLCTERTLVYNKCLNYQGGKEVMLGKWKGIRVILKSKKPLLINYSLPGYDDDDGILNIPSVEEFVNMVRNTLEMNLLVQTEESGTALLSKMWSQDFDEYMKQGEEQKSRTAAFNSIWSLLQQDEYLLMQYLQKNIHMPTIYGTCGHFYVMEHLPPGYVLSPTLFMTFGMGGVPWKIRALVAVKFLRMLKVFDYHMHDTLHLCDMKGENFGLSDGNTVKAIDVDMVFFESKLRQILGGQINCTVHEDCHFFDCKGFCDFKTKQCSGQRTNNNLQAMCEKVFKSHFKNGQLGLLHSAPWSIRDQLLTLLDKCEIPIPRSNTENLPGCGQKGGIFVCPNPSRERLRFSADIKIVDKLIDMLQSSLNI